MSPNVNTDDLKELGLALRVRRLRAGLTQYEVAARLGIHPGRLSEVECGRRRPGATMLDDLVEILEPPIRC